MNAVSIVLIGIIIVNLIIIFTLNWRIEGFFENRKSKAYLLMSVVLPFIILIINIIYRDTETIINFLISITSFLAFLILIYSFNLLIKRNLYFYAAMPIIAVVLYFLEWIFVYNLMTNRIGNFINIDTLIVFVIILGINHEKLFNRKLMVCGIMLAISIALVIIVDWFIGVDFKYEIKPVRLTREVLLEEGYEVGNDDFYFIPDVDFKNPFVFEYYIGEGNSLIKKFEVRYDQGMIDISD
jgi:hypothetical protein